MLTAQDIKKITTVVATKRDLTKLDKRMGAMEIRMSGVEIATFKIKEDVLRVEQKVDAFDEKLDRHLVQY